MSEDIKLKHIERFIEEIKQQINYVKIYKKNQRQKIISISKDGIVYFEHLSILNIFQKIGLKSKWAIDVKRYYQAIREYGLIIDKDVSLKFKNINYKNMVYHGGLSYTKINGKLLGLRKEELEQSKQNHPILRDIKF